MTSTAPSNCDATRVAWKTTCGWADGRLSRDHRLGDPEGVPGTFEIVDTGHGLLVVRTGGLRYLATQATGPRSTRPSTPSG